MPKGGSNKIRYPRNGPTRRVIVDETVNDFKALQKQGFFSPAMGYLVVDCESCGKPMFTLGNERICSKCQ
jgi:hypothetical protein